MCGIVGIIGSFAPEHGITLVARMNETIVHRGPDDQGHWAGEGIAFGMRRLSIIDLVTGQQPMWTEDGVGIVFNGEIYNYLKLRGELVSSGYKFHTKSDTEVILNLYHRDGIRAVHRLEGMFAICLYDSRYGVVHLVRDRLGKKPLYYSSSKRHFYFASEIKAILAAMDSKPGLDLQALHHYLTLRYVPAPATIWENIRKLEPGHILSVDLRTHNLSMECYWQVQFDAKEEDRDRDYLQEFEELFLAAVEKRLVASDVPVGVLLSGGIDSSAVSAAAVELGHHDFHTFSVAFADGGNFDERDYARMVSAHIGSRHHEIVISQNDFVDFLPDMVRFSDEPLADLAAVPLYYVSRLAQRHVKVVLSGEGSDEILAGYDMEQLVTRLEQLRKIDQFVPKSLLKFFARILPQSHGKALAALGSAGWSGLLRARATHITRHWSEGEKQALWRDHTDYLSTDELIRTWYQDAHSGHPLDQLQQVYCRSWLVEDLLMKADKMSMAASLELRVPFLDHALVEWAAKLPRAWKVGSKLTGVVSKRILREFARKRLPGTILTRTKQGFPVPAYRWLNGEMGRWAEGLICDPKSRLSEYLDISGLYPVLTAARQGDIVAAHKFWVLIIAEQWMRQWL
jgi:asparagine synthase (glutamine-hydrolysing)